MCQAKPSSPQQPVHSELMLSQTIKGKIKEVWEIKDSADDGDKVCKVLSIINDKERYSKRCDYFTQHCEQEDTTVILFFIF